MTTAERVRATVRRALVGPSAVEVLAEGARLFVRAGVWGGYQRHRDEWVRTGDLLELERMLRHVQELPQEQ